MANERIAKYTLWLALATSVLVVVTIVVNAIQLHFLRRSDVTARIAADAVAQQARATVTAESAIPVVMKVKLVQYADANYSDPPVHDPLEGGPIPDFCAILLWVTNLGRSSMHITGFCIEKFVGPNLPPEPNYRTVSRKWQPWLPPANAVVMVAENWFKPDGALSDVSLDTAEKEGIENETQSMWAYGYLTYTNVLGDELTHKFIVRWDLRLGFVAENREGYT